MGFLRFGLMNDYIRTRICCVSSRDFAEVHERLSRSLSAMSTLFGSGSRSMFSGGSRMGAAFEPSEATIERMMEMGFSRDHALDALESTESNRLEVAMEYALAHPPVERRRAARAERRRQMESLQAAASVPLPPDSPESSAANNANESEEATSSAAVPSAGAESMALDIPSSNEIQPSSNDSGRNSTTDMEVSEISKEKKKKTIETFSVIYAQTCQKTLRD